MPSVEQKHSKPDQSMAYDTQATTDRYIDHVVVPRPSFFQAPETEVVSRPMLASQEFQTARSLYELSGKKYRDKVDTAVRVADIVRGSLKWETYGKRQKPFGPESLDGSLANCVGSTLVISEALAELAIEHYIGFADSHSFIVMAKPPKRMDWIDSSWRGFDGEFSQALSEDTSITELIGGGKVQVADAKLDMLKVFSLRHIDDINDITGKNEWVKAGNKSNKNSFDPGVRQEDYTLYMRLYKSEVGRQVLVDYTNAEISANVNSGVEFADLVTKLGQLYPDVDPRQGLNKAFSKVKESLVRRRQHDSLLKIGEVAQAPLKSGDSSANALIAPDVFRLVGLANGDPTLITKAIDLIARMRTSTQKSRELDQRARTDLAKLAGKTALSSEVLQ